MRRAKQAMGMVLASFLCGCVVYPVYKTTVPDVQLVVRDDIGRPIEGARVVLFSRCLPNCLVTSKSQMTDAEGRVAFVREAEWQAENPLMIHGISEYRWVLCVERVGFSTYRSDIAASELPATVVPLQRGRSQSCDNTIL